LLSSHGAAGTQERIWTWDEGRFAHQPALMKWTGLLYPRTFSTDLDNIICESQGGKKGKLDANGGRRSSIPRIQRIGVTGLLTKHNDLKYLPARLCRLSSSTAAIAF